MNRIVNKEETGKLFKFCHQHFVYHYDLQVELVDHLASSIEEQWEMNPELPFEEALKNTFKKFGIHGFSKIKERKQKELQRKYNILLWKYLFDFFKWPKVMMTLAFTLILTSAFQIPDNKLWIIMPYFSGLTLFVLYYYFRIYPRRFKIPAEKGKKFLLLEQLKRSQLLAMLVGQLALQFPNFYNVMNFSHSQLKWGSTVISFIIVVFTVALYGELFYVPEKIKEHFRQQFPEFAA